MQIVTLIVTLKPLNTVPDFLLIGKLLTVFCITPPKLGWGSRTTKVVGSQISFIFMKF